MYFFPPIDQMFVLSATATPDTAKVTEMNTALKTAGFNDDGIKLLTNPAPKTYYCAA